MSRPSEPGPAAAALLGLCSALLSWLALPGVGASLLAGAALVPLALALRGAGPGRGCLVGLLYGGCLILSSAGWVAHGMVSLAKVSAPTARLLTLVFGLYQALPYAGFGLVYGWMTRQGRPPGSLRAAIWFTVPVAGFPALFPGGLAHALYDVPLLIQTADLGGWPLVLFQVVLCNWLLAEILWTWRRERAGALRRAMALAAVVAVIAGYGRFRLDQFGCAAAAPGMPALTAMVVQPNISPPPTDGGETVASVMAYTAAQARAHPGAALIVWPEVSWVVDCRDLPEGMIRDMLAGPEERRLLIPCRQAIVDPEKPPVVRVFRQREAGGEESRAVARGRPVVAAYNAAVLWGPHGPMKPAYRKMRPFPFGEHLPFRQRLPWLGRVFPGVGSCRAGCEAVALDLGGGRRIVPTLCYDILTPDVAIQGLRKGGNLLVTMGNDVWFGSGPAGAFHLALALFRTVETRMPMIRAANSGYSAHISAAGEILPGSLTPAFERTVSTHTLGIPLRPAPYPLLRPWLALAAILCCGLDLVRSVTARRREG